MKYFFTMLISIALFCACSTQQVSIDYDREVDFSTFKTYQFANQPLGVGKFDSIRIYTAIQNNLSEKGLKTHQNPDLIIRIQPDEYVSQRNSQTVGVGLGGGRGVFGGGVNVGIPIGGGKRLNQDYNVGMYNAQNEQLVWEGIVNLELRMNAKPESRKAAYEAGVKKLFENYPPK